MPAHFCTSFRAAVNIRTAFLELSPKDYEMSVKLSRFFNIYAISQTNIYIELTCYSVQVLYSPRDQ